MVKLDETQLNCLSVETQFGGFWSEELCTTLVLFSSSFVAILPLVSNGSLRSFSGVTDDTFKSGSLDCVMAILPLLYLLLLP